jgi:hypothetical protein
MPTVTTNNPRPTALPLPVPQAPVRKYSSQWLEEAEAAHQEALNQLSLGNFTEATSYFAMATSCASIAAGSEARWAGYRDRTRNA